MQTQKKRSNQREQQLSAMPRPEYIAAVRHLDGSQELFYVRYASDMDDARQLVLAEIGRVQSILMAVRG